MGKRSLKNKLRKWSAYLLTALFFLNFLGSQVVDAQIEKNPDLLILSPAGTLNSSPSVRSSFAVSFTVIDFNLVEPGQYNQENSPNIGHVFVFLDDVFYALVTSQSPIMFSGLQFGNHTIRLQLVNNDNTALSPDVSKSITVTVIDDPSLSLTEIINRLTTLQSTTAQNITNLYYVAIGNIILTAIVLILILRPTRKSQS